MNDFILVSATIGGLASGTIANKFIFNAIHPAYFTGARFFIAGMLLMALCWWQSPMAYAQKVARYWWPLVIVALFTNFIPAQLKALALAHTLTSKVALIGSLDPFVTAIFTRFLYGYRLSRRQILGIIIGCCAVILVILTHDRINTASLFSFEWPELAALAWVILSRFGWIQAQRLLQKSNLSSRELNSISMLIGGLLGLLSALLLADTVFTGPVTVSIIGAIIYTILAGNMIAYDLYARMLMRYHMLFVSVVMLALPISLYFLGWLLLNEPLYQSFWLSVVLMAVALWLFYDRKQPIA